MSDVLGTRDAEHESMTEIELTLGLEDAQEVQNVLNTIRMTASYNATPPHSSELGRIANEIRQQKEQQMRGPGVLIGLCGLPGAGKSYVAETMGNIYECPVVSMGDAIREAAPNDMDSDELGEFAAQTRDDDPEQIPEWTVNLLRGCHPEVAIVDGIRSLTDYKVLHRNYDLYLVKVNATAETRLSRVRNRAREGEEAFTLDDLLERDEHEWDSLGFGELLRNVAVDSEIENDGDERKFYLRLSEIVRRELPAEVQNGDIVTELTPQ